MNHYRYLVTIEYAGVFDIGDKPLTDDELEDVAIDWAFDGGYRDRTVIDVEVEAIDNAGN
jgi:hypothetical protein